MPTPHDHYFTADPATPLVKRQFEVELAGRRVRVSAAPGVFSADRLDLGTSVLLRQVPLPPESGHLLDLGSGWGPLALSMAMYSPEATVWGLDVNARALTLLDDNAAALGLRNVRPVTAAQIPPDVMFAAIWSNPPIRIGKAALHELLSTWLVRLETGGTAYLVVQRNLGADSLQTWLTGSLGPAYGVSRFASSKGFRVLAVSREEDPEDSA